MFSYREFAPPEVPLDPADEAGLVEVGGHVKSNESRDFTRAMKAMIALDDVW